MQPRQFDTLSRSLADQTSRRRAFRAAGISGLLGFLAGSSSNAMAQVDQVTCEMTLQAETVIGPNEGVKYEGVLTLLIEEDGAIDDAYLTIEDEEFDAVGQATGRELFLRVVLEDDSALTLFGVGERDIELCRGVVEGSFSGPEMQDLGRWTLS